MDQRLLEKFFNGECSPEECQIVGAWYSSGEADKAMSERIAAYWEKQKKQGNTPAETDTWGRDALYNTINKRIDKSAKEEKIVSIHDDRPFFTNRWRQRYYAAVLTLLLLFTGWWYFKNFQEDANQPAHPISYVNKQTARGEKRTIMLDDGTVVKLNADSRLWYSQAFGQHSIREVYLKGEAYFDVARDTLHPFQIHTGSVTTMVLGTSFNVQAFAPDEKIAVSVVSGKVKVSRHHTPHVQIIYLLPGEQAMCSKADSVITKKKFDYREVLSWKDGTLYFKNAEFSAIVTTLERWYGVEIEVQRQGIENGFSGSYTHKSLESVLKGMSFVLNFDYEINGKKIIIK